MEQAVVFSKRATCSRLKVGTIITKNNLQLGEGYNGSISGDAHCEDDGCLLNDEGRCIRTIHSEQNALLNAMKKGVSGGVSGGTAYITHESCETCSKLLAQAGIIRIVYLVPYANKYNSHFLKGIEVVEFEGVNKEELLGNVIKINKK
jgi:dCMP deaminase